MRLDSFPTDEGALEFGSKEKSLGVGAHREIAQGTSVRTSSGLILDIENDEKFEGFLEKVWQGVNKKTWIFENTGGDIEKSMSSLHYKLAVLEMLAGEVLKDETLNEMLHENPLGKTYGIIDADKAVLMESAFKMCGVRNCNGVRTEVGSAAVRTDFEFELESGGEKYVVLMSALDKVPAGVPIPFKLYETLLSKNGSVSHTALPTYFETIPGSQKIAETRKYKSAMRDITPLPERTETSSQPEKVFSLEEDYEMYGRSVRTAVILTKLLNVPYEVFTEENPQISSAEFRDVIIDVNSPELTRLHESLYKSFIEKYESEGESLDITPEHPLYADYHTVVVQGMNPRRANHFAAVVSAGWALLPTHKDVQQLTVSLAKERLTTTEYSYLLTETRTLNDLIKSRKHDIDVSTGQRRNFSEDEISQLYTYAQFLWNKIYKDMSPNAENI
jgi:hypothetical protein